MIRQICNYGQPAQRALLDALVRVNPSLLAMEETLTYGAPEAVGSSPNAVTTSLTVGSGYRGVRPYGPVTVSYYRLSLAAYFQGISPWLDGSHGTSNARLFASLLDRYQLYFTPLGGENAHSDATWVIDTQATPPTATLQAAASNLLWYGSVTFDLP